MAQSIKKISDGGAMTLRRIGDDEAFSPKNTMEGNKKVRSVFAIKKDQNSPRHEKVCLVDFGNCSEDEILEMAMYAAKVKIQSLLRAMPSEQMLHVDTLSTVDVKRDLLEAPARSADPNSAAIKSLMKTGLSEEVARQVLSDAQAKASKAKEDGKRDKNAA